MSEPFSTIPAGDLPNSTPGEDGSAHPDVRYEQSELWLSWVGAVLGGIAIAVAVVSVVGWWLLRANESAADRVATESHYSIPHDRLPRGPRLEPLDRIDGIFSSDAITRQIALERILHSYGQTADDGFVHIPIELAIKQAAQTLLVRQQSAEESAHGFGLLGGGEANSGRVYLEAPPWFGPSR